MVRSNGSVELLGRTVEVTGAAVGMAFAGYLIRLRVDPDVVDPRYLALMLATPQLRRQIEFPARSTSGVNNINTQEIRRLLVPVPTLKEQAEVLSRTERLFRAADAVEAQIDRAADVLASAGRAILSKAIPPGNPQATT